MFNSLKISSIDSSIDTSLILPLFKIPQEYVANKRLFSNTGVFKLLLMTGVIETFLFSDLLLF